MIIVHHLERSRSQRILWLLEELGLDYEVRRYARDPRTLQAPAALRRVHPLGKSPVVAVDGHILAESGAIIDYFVARHDDGRLAPPPGTPERLRYTYWLHYAEGSAMPPLLLSLVFRRLPRAPMSRLLRPLARRIADGTRRAFVDPQVRTHLDYMEAELDGREGFAGAFSAADIQMSFPVEAALARGDGDHPNLRAFLERMRARPAYRRAIERGGPFEIPA